MNKREIPVMNVGISLVILIFMNVCLAAFAVLSLQNAISDYSLSKKTAVHTTEYYKAVNKVQEQLAQKNQEIQEKWEQEKKIVQTEKKASKKEKKASEKDINKNTNKTETKGLTQKKSVNQEFEQQIEITESVSKSQKLVVTLELESDSDKELSKPQYYIKKWQLCSSDDWEADDSLDVYQSGE